MRPPVHRPGKMEIVPNDLEAVFTEEKAKEDLL